LARIAEDFDSFTVDVGRVMSCGETVLVEARNRGTLTQTGKSIDAQVAHVWDFRDGKGRALAAVQPGREYDPAC
jgi:uncharacterized protein